MSQISQTQSGVMSGMGKTAQSPANLMRMQNLTERMRDFQSTSKSEREGLRQEVERGVKRLEDLVAKQSLVDRSAFSQIKELMGTTQDAIATQKAQREILDEKKTKEVQIIETQLGVDFNLERQHRKELEQKFARYIEEKYVASRGELEKERASRDAGAEQHRQEVSAACSELLKELEEDRRFREEEFTKIEKIMTTECQKLKDAIAEEQRQRSEQTDQLYNRLTEVVKELQNKIKAEREERESTEESLLELLEQTCKKVEENMS